jgi:hypothetical protein
LATFDLPEQMAALQAVRAELEAALGNDENWRALRRAGAPRINTEDDRRDRDARLEKALEANPLYLAWTHIGAAIDALHDAAHVADAEEAGEELPRDIRDRIHADAPNAADHDLTEAPATPTHDDEAEPVTQHVSQEAGQGRGSRKLVAVPSIEPSAAPTEQVFSDRLQKLEADMDELNEALEAPSRAVADPIAPSADSIASAAEPATRKSTAAAPSASVASTTAKARDVADRDVPTVRHLEPAEAKVTFVKRKAPASAPAKDGPAAPRGDGFVPLTATPEEAEVAIVKPEDPKVAPVRRFLKALSGE